jgi:hypothetical protein
MKKVLAFLLLTILAISCKNETKKEPLKEVTQENFPEELGKVFEAHGGIARWRQQNVLSFNLGEEVHTVALHSRKTIINAPKNSLGFDGKNTWVSDTTVYKKDPKFFYNLYFYFYAMPFVLADDGIVYEKTTPITFNDKTYPGYKISYHSNVGTSPDDNYFIYFNPDTNLMEWLGYTVTYFSKKPTVKTNVIRYNSWENVNGLLLPKAITWYEKDNNGAPIAPSKPATEFSLPLISTASLPDSFFAKPTSK